MCHNCLYKRSLLGSFHWVWPSRSRLELLHVNSPLLALGRERRLIKTPPATPARLQLIWLTTLCFCARAFARWLLCVNSEGAPGEACEGCCWSTAPLHSPEASLSLLQRTCTSLSNGPWRFTVSSTPEMPTLGFKDVFSWGWMWFLHLFMFLSGLFSTTDV